MVEPDLGGLLGRGREDLSSKLEGLYSKAYQVAGELGVIVGRVTRYWSIEVGPGKTVKVEVDPEVYFGRPWESPVHRVGDYLVGVDPKSLRIILLRVKSVTRADLLASIGVEPPISRYTGNIDPLGAATVTILEAEPVVEAPYGLDSEPVPAVTSLEPQSPVAEPRPEVLEKLLGLPGEGLLLGVLAGPWGPMAGGIPVRLPYKALLQHTLIVGTTGSGKTTLIKNSIASLYSDKRSPGRPVVLVIDLNEDYVQLPLPGNPPPEWASRAYKSVRPPRGAVVVVPVTLEILRSVSGACEGLGGLISDYAGRVIRPLAMGEGLEVEERSGSLPRGIIRVGGVDTFEIIPYAINTTLSRPEELTGLLPGLTLHGRELLRRLREKYRKTIGSYPPLPLVAAGLLAYAVTLRGGGRRGEKDSGEDQPLMSALELLSYHILGGEDVDLANTRLEGIDIASHMDTILGVLERLMPHRGTVEALYRRVSGLVESGIVDIIEVCRGETRLLGEPRWEDIVSLAAERDWPIVVDLKPASESGMGGYEGPRAAAYRMLQRLIAWKQRAYAERRKTPTLLVVLDEAHQFFPQEKGPQEEQEANRQVAGMISRVARLGRARGIGLLFATHSPKDLHDIIIQLANNKILLRTERGQLERLDVPGDLREMLPRMPDRTLAVMSHTLKGGYILVVTPPPVVMHHDISAAL
ncbi:MAG: DUF87 domain-containing protein [Desulfurococcales archaeon]|nr:DUF87 domain-containing protein [Desulfurococcales archaeon]